jgi:hypothetical protein
MRSTRHVAGIAALILALQPLVTAMIAAPLLANGCDGRSGWCRARLLGVALVVWHKIDLRRYAAALTAV